MKIAAFITILFLKVTFLAIGQSPYTVSLDDRNAAVQLIQEAIADIKTEDYSSAFKKLIKSLEIDSLFRETYLHIYQLYTLNPEDPEQTLGALNKGSRIFKDDDELFFYCAEVYRSNAQTDLAIEAYTNAIKYAKVNGEDFYLVPYYYLNRGNLFLTIKQYELAIKDYCCLLKLDSVSTSGLTNRGIAYYKLGEKQKACEDWQKAIANGYEKANLYYQKFCK